MKARSGDRVKLKTGADRGLRGTVKHVRNGHLVVELEDQAKLVELPAHHVTNFSLAARKAWKSMPHKRVGRPKGSRVCDRVSVTLRIDRDLWQEFRALESKRQIAGRTRTINDMLREKITELKSERH